jgi:16S rRNA (cytosine967-C5)-methyltransferase
MNKKSRSARYIAIKVLYSWEESRLPVDQIMEQHIANMILADPRDRQLIMSLVYGVIRWRGYLDWVVEKFSKHPVAKIKNRTLQGLRTGILQLLFMDRVPASAAINETVQALKDMKQPRWLTGYVNGLLRSVVRQRENIPNPLDPENSNSLPEAAMLSHPEWLIDRWKKRYGDFEAIKICRENNTQTSLCLRVNVTLTTPSALVEKLKTSELHVAPGEYSPIAIKLHGYHGQVTAIPGFRDGLFQVQDEAAQLISLLLGPMLPGKLYLDGCAGLGGKTSHLAQMLPPESSLSAIEPNPGRLMKLKENLERLRLSKTVTIVEGTLDSLLPDNKEKFAGILIDAPCSGLGVIRKHPDIRWNRSPDDLHRYQKMQKALLKTAAQLLAANGILVYATCSTEPEENEEVIKNFLARNPQFELSDCRDVLPENGNRLVGSQGFFQTLPGQDDLDGFFAARLIKLKSED